jgi:hypothetical protein
MICVNCDNEVTIENALGLCNDCDKNFIAGLHEYRGGNEDEKAEEDNQNNYCCRNCRKG